MTFETLEKLSDSELEQCIEQARGLLATREENRKKEAVDKARSILAAVGLSFTDVTAKRKGAGKPAPYRGGHCYQHPQNKDLVWNANGQKPNWLRDLERAGGKAVELPLAANDNARLRAPANDNGPGKSDEKLVKTR